MIELKGSAMDQGWVPHEPETWKYRFATLKFPRTMSHWNGHGANPEYTKVDLKAGHRVQIVMVSRFGDVGITDFLALLTVWARRRRRDRIRRAELDEGWVVPDGSDFPTS